MVRIWIEFQRFNACRAKVASIAWSSCPPTQCCINLLCRIFFQGIEDEVDAETEEVLNEFSFLGRLDSEEGSSDKAEEWNYTSNRVDDVSLGELAQLTVNNDSDVNMDVSLSYKVTTCVELTLKQFVHVGHSG